MRIAMFCSGRFTTPAPLKTIFAPLRITSVLADEMVKRGHKVTLFATQGTKSKAKVETLGLLPLENRKDIKKCIDIRDGRVMNFYEQIFISEIYRRAEKGDFDIIHIHPAEQAIGFAANSKTPTVFTLHDPISCWRKFAYGFYKNSKNIYFISISDSQRKPFPDLKYIGTIYNGIDMADYSFGKKEGKYLFFSSRIVAQKGLEFAIEVARKTGYELKIAGEILDKEYWQMKIKPLIKGKIQYLGVVSPRKLANFYKNAKALIFSIQWEEPFGLVMTEAMASGTPVIAFDRGSVREIVEDGKTGFIVKPHDKNGNINISGLTEAIEKIGMIDRQNCRNRVEKNFSLEKMIDEYEKAYNKILAKQ